jgi:hypothetical protein
MLLHRVAWYDDDDDYWDYNDGNFMDQTKGLDHNRDKVRTIQRATTTSSGNVFLTVLEGTVYTIGALFSIVGVYLLLRWYNGQPLPFVETFDPESAGNDVEATPLMRMDITPDVIRT